MLERNKHNGFSTVILKTCYSKKCPQKGHFCNLRFFHMKVLKSLCKSKNRLTQAVSCGAPSGTRTRDTLIKSQVLYQLS